MPANFLGADYTFSRRPTLFHAVTSIVLSELAGESSFRKLCFEEEISNDFAVMARVQLS